MTEEEAKGKWCPMVRYVPSRNFTFGRVKAAINRWVEVIDTQPNPLPSRCIASECMMWVDEHKWNWGDKDFSEITVDVVGGHCGLAR